MFKNIVPVVLEKHKDLKVKPITKFDFVKSVNMASVMVHEFSKVAPTYPILFLEDPKKDQFKPVALFGLEQGENLFVRDDKWQASYIPAIIRRYPFVLAGSEGGKKFTVCIDDQSEFVGTDEGQPLFTEEGKPSQSLETVKKYLQELQQMELFTNEFVKYLAEKNLFTPMNMNLRVGKEVKSVTGAYIINEERLNNLSAESFQELREKRYLPVIYAHLGSLGQMERLIGFKDTALASTSKVEQTDS
ncbi:MAG: SapC family protein [Synoicihabitans sp.]